MFTFIGPRRRGRQLDEDAVSNSPLFVSWSLELGHGPMSFGGSEA